MTDSILRFPKIVESNAFAPQVLQYLDTHSRPLWSEGVIKTPYAKMTSEMSGILCKAKSNDHVIRGLENAQRRLESETRGLHLADRHSGVARGVRVLRLLVLADDGAERFYRQVEALLRKYGDRVMAVRLDVDADVLGALIFGQRKIARLLMPEHKEAVADLLLTLAGQGAS